MNVYPNAQSVMNAFIFFVLIFIVLFVIILIMEIHDRLKRKRNEERENISRIDF